MSWISRVRKAIPFIAKKETTTDTLWHKCPGCAQMIFTREWEENLSVCPKCDHHGRIGPDERFAQILDEGSVKILPTPQVKEDPLKFRDTKKYTDRIKAARASTGDQDALINASGKVDGLPIVIGVQNFAYMGGVDGRRGRRGVRAGRRGGDQAQMPLRDLHGGGRRADAGGHLVPHADAARDGSDSEAA